MADDHAKWASSVYGNSEIQTPTMDFLAQIGVQYNKAYTITAVCSPARASFFTGRLPSQHGVHDVLSEHPDFDHQWLQGETFISEFLQRQGYTTALFGKWHSTTDCKPVHRGWDRWFTYNVHVEGWQNQYIHQGPTHFSDQGAALTLEGDQSTNLTDKALDFLKSDSNQKPFFLFMGYVDTHAPFSGLPEPIVDQYRSSSFNSIPAKETSYLPKRNDYSAIPENHQEQLAQYYAGVTNMDKQAGRILEYLKNTGELENTLVIFTSDHGHMNGHHGLYGKGNATTPQNFYRESYEVPLLIHWPDATGIREKQVSIPVNQCDLFQTILDIAQVELSAEEKLRLNSPGNSLLAAVGGDSISWTEYQYAEYGNARMIANEQYKFIIRLPPLKPGYESEFFDLKKDPRETSNRIKEAQYAATIEKMETALRAYFSKYENMEHSGARLEQQALPNKVPIWMR